MAAKAGVLDRLSMPAKLVFGLVLMAIVAVLYFVMFFADIDAQIASAVGQEAQLQGELARAEDARAAYQKDVEEKTRKQQQAREQKKVLPDDAETPAFLAAIQGVATVSGIQLSSYNPEDEVPAQYYAKVPMSLAMKGRFHQVARFFYGVGQLDRIINIEDIEMKLIQGPAGTDEVMVDVKCLATAFRALRAGDAAGAGGRRRR
jgi:type IV pilus assembly protein PilO